MNLPQVAKRRIGNGSRSRYIGQLSAIRDFAVGREKRSPMEFYHSPQATVDEIMGGGFRGKNLLKDLIQFDDFELVDSNAPIDMHEAHQWYERQWWQMRCNLMVVEAVDRLGGKREFCQITGMPYNLINGLYSFRSIFTDTALLFIFQSCAEISDPQEYGHKFRSLYQRSQR